MARQDANEQFQVTSFLDGANANYIEQLYARFEQDPSSVAPEWQAFFKALDDSPADVLKAAQGASWKKKNWPIAANGELVPLNDARCPEEVRRALRTTGPSSNMLSGGADARLKSSETSINN